VSRLRLLRRRFGDIAAGPRKMNGDATDQQASRGDYGGWSATRNVIESQRFDAPWLNKPRLSAMRGCARNAAD